MTSLLPVILTVMLGALPDCVHQDQSYLHFPGNRGNEQIFYDRLQALSDGSTLDLNIWHIGGSHVQAGHFTNRLRENFVSIRPSAAGDRGFIFPYTLANTNYNGTYRIYSEGRWLTSRSPAPSPLPVTAVYGITGIAAYTCDSTAALTIDLTLSEDWTFTDLRILGVGSSDEVLPYLMDGKDSVFFKKDTETAGWTVHIGKPRAIQRVQFKIPAGQSLIFNGFQPVSGKHGINVTGTGVNGARTTTWLDVCTNFEQDFSLVKPDLAILALGINDSACPADSFDPEKYKANYRRLLDMVLRHNPDCALVFVTNNDSYRFVGRGRMAHNDNGDAVQKALYELAEEYDAGIWDLYAVMGGSGTATQWRDAGLLLKDRLHFTKRGYELLGDLLFNAIIEDYKETRGQQ